MSEPFALLVFMIPFEFFLLTKPSYLIIFHLLCENFGSLLDSSCEPFALVERFAKSIQFQPCETKFNVGDRLSAL